MYVWYLGIAWDNSFFCNFCSALYNCVSPLTCTRVSMYYNATQFHPLRHIHHPPMINSFTTFWNFYDTVPYKCYSNSPSRNPWIEPCWSPPRGSVFRAFNSLCLHGFLSELHASPPVLMCLCLSAHKRIQSAPSHVFPSFHTSQFSPRLTSLHLTTPESSPLVFLIPFPRFFYLHIAICTQPLPGPDKAHTIFPIPFHLLLYTCLVSCSLITPSHSNPYIPPLLHTSFLQPWSCPLILSPNQLHSCTIFPTITFFFYYFPTTQTWSTPSPNCNIYSTLPPCLTLPFSSLFPYSLRGSTSVGGIYYKYSGITFLK